MILMIDDTMKVDEIQDRYNECFPNLKLEFYSKPHKTYQGSDKRFLIKPGSFVHQVRKSHFNGNLEIKSWQTVSNVEDKLKKLFGLNAQIFRKDAIVGWVQTSASDKLTLEQQNKIYTNSLRLIM